MTLDELLLQKLSEWRPTGIGRYTLATSDEDSGWTVRLNADRNDVLGCLVWELTLNRTAAPAHKPELGSWANQIAERATGLLEPLKVIEVDSARDEALLRSKEPSHRAGQLSFYEVLLRGGGEVLMRRFQAREETGAHRQQVAFALTHEALAKLAGDLTAGW